MLHVVSDVGTAWVRGCIICMQLQVIMALLMHVLDVKAMHTPT